MMDLDGVRFDIECPQCKFSTQIFYRDARKQFKTAMRRLEEAISKLNTTITLRSGRAPAGD